VSDFEPDENYKLRSQFVAECMDKHYNALKKFKQRLRPEMSVKPMQAADLRGRQWGVPVLALLLLFFYSHVSGYVARLASRSKISVPTSSIVTLRKGS
jgi:hypothetical protein